MKEYKVTGKQLETLKKISESYREICSDLCGELAVTPPVLSENDMNRILDSQFLLDDDGIDTDALKSGIETVASELLSDCAAGLDEATIQDLQNQLQEVERELKYLVEDIENQQVEDTSIDKASYMFRRAGTAELEAIARKWAEYFDADITIRRNNEGKNIDKKISLAEAEIGMIYAYLVALTRTCAEDEEDGGPSISEMIAIVLFCAENHIKRTDLSEADYDVLFRGLDEYFRSLDHAR